MWKKLKEKERTEAERTFKHRIRKRFVILGKHNKYRVAGDPNIKGA